MGRDPVPTSDYLRQVLSYLPGPANRQGRGDHASLPDWLEAPVDLKRSIALAGVLSRCRQLVQSAPAQGALSPAGVQALQQQLTRCCEALNTQAEALRQARSDAEALKGYQGLQLALKVEMDAIAADLRQALLQAGGRAELLARLSETLQDLVEPRARQVFARAPVALLSAASFETDSERAEILITLFEKERHLRMAPLQALLNLPLSSSSLELS